MERRNITTKEIPEIIRLLREGTYALENYLYELVAKDAIRNFDKYSLRDLIELYSNLGKHGYVSESKEKIFQEIKRRITVKDAVDIVNNGFGSALPYGILEVKKIVFKQIAENSTNEEVDGLDVHKFNNLLSDILSDNNRTPDEQITARYRYPINSLVGDIAKAEKAREELIKYGAKKISEKFLRRLVTVLRDDDVIGHDIGIAVLFAAIGTPICIEGLFKVLDLLSDNLADNRGRLIYTRLRRMSLVLNILKDQEILYSILTDLEALYTVTELVFSRIHIDDKKETTFVLAQIAQIMERSARDSVKRRRTFMEWLKGERPWAKRKIRKTLAEIEKVDRLILYHGIMDRQYPILCSYRNVVSPIPREVMEAIAGDLERILRDINNPYFDYFELLRKPEILNYISAQRIPLALSFFAALIENMYKELKNYGDWHYSYQAINNIIDAIVQYGGAEALELLIRIKKLNWISLKFDVRAGYIRRHLKEAIAKLEARQG